MIFSKTVSYALQTVIFLSNSIEQNPVLQQEIAKALNIPHHYLGKILQSLTSSGLIGSKTGKFGGFYLNTSPDRISLYDIIKVFEGDDYFEECVLGFPGCDDETPCPVHNEWKPAKLIINDFMNNHTVADWAKSLGIKLDYIASLANSPKNNK